MSCFFCPGGLAVALSRLQVLELGLLWQVLEQSGPGKLSLGRVAHLAEHTSSLVSCFMPEASRYDDAACDFTAALEASLTGIYWAP